MWGREFPRADNVQQRPSLPASKLLRRDKNKRKCEMQQEYFSSSFGKGSSFSFAPPMDEI